MKLPISKKSKKPETACILRLPNAAKFGVAMKDWTNIGMRGDVIAGHSCATTPSVYRWQVRRSSSNCLSPVEKFIMWNEHDTNSTHILSPSLLLCCWNNEDIKDWQQLIMLISEIWLYFARHGPDSVKDVEMVAVDPKNTWHNIWNNWL